MANLLSPANSLRVPGRLCADPTQPGLALAFPHGGTDLALVRAIVFRPGFQSEEITAEEFGGEVVEYIHSAQSPILACVLVGLSDAMVSRVFPETAVGASSGDRIIRKTSTTKAGRLASGQGFKALFSPRDVSKHPGLLAYNAVPIIEETAELPLNTEESLGIAVLFRLLRNDAGKTYEIAKLEDMVV